jgi:hypothetical protein
MQAARWTAAGQRSEVVGAGPPCRRVPRAPVPAAQNSGRSTRPPESAASSGFLIYAAMLGDPVFVTTNVL